MFTSKFKKGQPMNTPVLTQVVSRAADVAKQFDLQVDWLPVNERHECFSTPMLTFHRPDAPDLVGEILIGLPVAEPEYSAEAQAFASSAVDESGRFTKDHIAVQFSDSTGIDIMIQADWDNMTQDPSGESDDDIDVPYIRAPYSSLIIAARLIADSKLSDDVRIEFFAITTGSENGACADEVGGRHGTTVGNVRANGARALQGAMNELDWEQVAYQLTQVADTWVSKF
jgi:hypothetical protein